MNVTFAYACTCQDYIHNNWKYHIHHIQRVVQSLTANNGTPVNKTNEQMFHIMTDINDILEEVQTNINRDVSIPELQQYTIMYKSP